jgi:hypothetical protein
VAEAGKLQVRRFLTETPLARQFERGFPHTPRGAETIPWSAFRRERYPQPALALAAHAMRGLAVGEYGAISLFARAAAALSLLGAPFDLVAAAARIPGDELRHADLALRMAALCEGRALAEVGVEVDRPGISRTLDRPMDIADLDALMVEVAAIGETLAGALLSECRRRARDATARALFTAVVGDEVHHARLGWYYLSWRAPLWSRVERQRVADHAGGILVGVETRFWRGRDAPAGSKAAARALGVLDSAGQQGAVRAVMEEEVVPALDALGLGASHAWRARRRGR